MRDSEYKDGGILWERHDIDGRTCWFYRDRWEGGIVNVRLAGQDDTSWDEPIIYDPKCSKCWLGHAHSGNYHRQSIA